VFEYKEVVTTCNVHDLIHVARKTSEVNGNDGFRLRSDGSLDLGRIKIVGIRVNVDEHRDAVRFYNGASGRDKCVGRNNDLIARFHSRCDEGKSQSNGSVHTRYRVLASAVSSKFPFDCLDISLTVRVTPLAGSRDGSHRLNITVIKNRPTE